MFTVFYQEIWRTSYVSFKKSWRGFSDFYMLNVNRWNFGHIMTFVKYSTKLKGDKNYNSVTANKDFVAYFKSSITKEYMI